MPNEAWQKRRPPKRDLESRGNINGIGSVEDGDRTPDGRFAKGNPGSPGRRPGRTLEQMVKDELGVEGREDVAKALAKQIRETAARALAGDVEAQAALATDERFEWYLRRSWPVPQKIEATVTGERTDAPELPDAAERDRAVAEILAGEDAPQPTAPGSDKLQ